jgi:hypothetical protein
MVALEAGRVDVHCLERLLLPEPLDVRWRSVSVSEVRFSGFGHRVPDFEFLVLGTLF